MTDCPSFLSNMHAHRPFFVLFLLLRLCAAGIGYALGSGDCGPGGQEGSGSLSSLFFSSAGCGGGCMGRVGCSGRTYIRQSSSHGLIIIIAVITYSIILRPYALLLKLFPHSHPASHSTPPPDKEKYHLLQNRQEEETSSIGRQARILTYLNAPLPARLIYITKHRLRMENCQKEDGIR